MTKTTINTDQAPAAIGAYSQAVKTGNTVYISGQIPLLPENMELVEGGIREQIHQVFKNLSAVANAAGGSLDDCAKLTIFMTDLSNFASVNEIMAEYIKEPYPARSTVEVAALPKNVAVEIDAILTL